MQRRLFFTEGTSDKFWYIDCVGDAVTVTYGRRGTAGTTKTKEYGDAAKALADAEKQVAAKLKKGYADEAGGEAKPLTPAKPAPEKPAPAPEAVAEPAVVLEPLELPENQQDIGWNLTPFDLAMDLEAEVAVELDEEPFDEAAEAERASRIARAVRFSDGYGRYYSWVFSEPVFTTLPSPQRAAWWHNYLSNVPVEEGDRIWGTHLPAGVVMALAARGFFFEDEKKRFVSVPTLSTLGSRVMLPLMSEEPRAQLEARAAADIPAPIVKQGWQLHLDDTVFFAAALGGREVAVAEALAEIPNGALRESNALQMHSVVLAAATPEDRVRLAQRIGARVYSPELMLAFLVSTGAAGFGFMAKHLEAVGANEGERCLSFVAAAMTGPGAVPFFAELLKGRHAALANAWLSDHLPQVLVADLSAAKAAPLGSVLRAVPIERLREALPHTTSGVRSLIQQILAEADRPLFDPATPWWAEAVVATKTKLPTWLKVEALPPLLIGDERLGPNETQTLLRALASANRDEPLVAAVRSQVETRSRDRFAVELFELWMANGAPSKDKWMMTGAGSIGDDLFVLHLTPLIREWPGLSQHQRAVAGLDALRNVGTNLALQQISGIASKVKFAALKKRSAEAMEEIANSMGLTRDQLEDRVIPDGGLDERGTRSFDYGPRQFLAMLTPEAKVIARLLDEQGRPTGKVLSTLPNPLKSDDETLAKEAKAEFNLLKKNVSGLAGIQAKRFEKAMISGRRWSAEEFEMFISPQPLLRGLLAGVVWGGYDGDQRVALFRLDEDGAPVDADDEPVELSGRTVGIVHPIDLSKEELSTWGEVQSDFELTTPFPQLDRPIFELTPDQGEDVELHGVPSGEIEPGKLYGAFAKYGWERGQPQDAGVVTLHAMAFESAGLTAVIEYEPGMWMGPISEQDKQSVTSVYILEGKHDAANFGWGWSTRWSKEVKVPWSQVPRAVVNEVFTVINAMSA